MIIHYASALIVFLHEIFYFAKQERHGRALPLQSPVAPFQLYKSAAVVSRTKKVLRLQQTNTIGGREKKTKRKTKKREGNKLLPTDRKP
jgi:hypothetical protein